MHTPHLRAGLGLRPYLPSSDSPAISNPVVPHTPHKAYCAGLEAARRGDDLVTVVHAALRIWPLDDLGQLAELITCASLGFWAEGGRL